MTDGVSDRVLYHIDSPKAQELMVEINQKYGSQNWHQYISVGDSAWNEVMQSRIISAVYGVIPPQLWAMGARAAERKFHIDTQSVYEKIFTYSKPASEYGFLPKSATTWGEGYLHTIAGLKGDPALEDIGDIYFTADAEETESMFGLKQLRGKFATRYGVTFRRSTMEVVRAKVYVYDDESSHWDWEGAVQLWFDVDEGRHGVQS